MFRVIMWYTQAKSNINCSACVIINTALVLGFSLKNVKESYFFCVLVAGLPKLAQVIILSQKMKPLHMLCMLN